MKLSLLSILISFLALSAAAQKTKPVAIDSLRVKTTIIKSKVPDKYEERIQTEEEITNAIQQLGHEQLTIVIIAHRYTSLRYCDKIYELDNGHISACLTYEDLVAQTNH